MLTNKDIAKVLSHIAFYLEMQDDHFRIRAYEHAAETLYALTEEAADIYAHGGIAALEDIPGVGESIAEKIEELLKTGKLRYYDQLAQKIPITIDELSGLEGLGAKRIKVLYKKLGVKDLAGLEHAAKAGKIAKLEGFGTKSEKNILQAIAFYRASHTRFLLSDVVSLVEGIAKKLGQVDGVTKVMVAGSIRRRKETVGDGDILAVSTKPKKVIDYFTAMDNVAAVYGKGDTKGAVKLRNGMDIDLRVVPAESFGAALNYFTGSKDHNVALRQIAIKKKMKLNEYGLFKGKKMVAGKTEEEVYRALGLQYVEPEMRENRGEIEAARKGALPQLIGYHDLKGDLQVQTSWTDGSNSIKEMALAAQKAGLQYIVVTDHTKALAMTGGLDEKGLRKQAKEIDRVNKELSGITVLKGAEVNILKDGSLDISDEALAQLDVVGAAVHTQFRLPREEMTARLIRAMENPHLDILFHPTARLINKREPIDVDMGAIIAAAVRTGTILEIDAIPDRLDLKDEYILQAKKAGAKFAIDSDAHNRDHFGFLWYGIAQARRGWLEPKDVINTLYLQEMLKCLKGGGKKR
jgi:DNA polymerase (family 10)